MNTMPYKSYAVRMKHSEEDGRFVGHIANIRDVIGFHGGTVAELRAAFEEAVDGYLESCRRLGRDPNHPYSGQLRLRLPPELHAHAAMVAETQGESLNTWLSEVIERGVATV